jgi:DNA polymerase-3 subunit delta'
VAGDRRRQRLEEARLEELEVRRNQALWPTLEDAGSSIFLPMVEEIRSRAVRRPAMGRSTAFVIGDAERMVSQASSPEAANAFLKLLEEPPTDTLIFLTSSRPGSLLPTIRSRVLEVRVTAPAEDDATRFLAEHAHVELPEAVAAIRQSDGSIGRALELVTGESTGSRTAALRVLECAVRGSRGDRLRVAAGFPSAGARGPFCRRGRARRGVRSGPK